jgi:hypothetical protein
MTAFSPTERVSMAVERDRLAGRERLRALVLAVAKADGAMSDRQVTELRELTVTLALPDSSIDTALRHARTILSAEKQLGPAQEAAGRCRGMGEIVADRTALEGELREAHLRIKPRLEALDAEARRVQSAAGAVTAIEAAIASARISLDFELSRSKE